MYEVIRRLCLRHLKGGGGGASNENWENRTFVSIYDVCVARICLTRSYSLLHLTHLFDSLSHFRRSDIPQYSGKFDLNTKCYVTANKRHFCRSFSRSMRDGLQRINMM